MLSHVIRIKPKRRCRVWKLLTHHDSVFCWTILSSSQLKYFLWPYFAFISWQRSLCLWLIKDHTYAPSAFSFRFSNSLLLKCNFVIVIIWKSVLILALALVVLKHDLSFSLKGEVRQELNQGSLKTLGNLSFDCFVMTDMMENLSLFSCFYCSHEFSGVTVLFIRFLGRLLLSHR